MFIVTLSFAENRGEASQWMAGHKQWIADGFDQGLVLMVGSMADGAGGIMLLRGDDHDAVAQWVAQDPFVIHGVVGAHIQQFTPNRMVSQLEFLQEQAA